MSNKFNWRPFVEVTTLAVVLFALPAAYSYNRDSVEGAQNTIYNKLFAISDDQYTKARVRQRDEMKKERETLDQAMKAQAKRDKELTQQ